MANTTNYNWETPDDTDLVKDGAAAIRTLGSSVDTTTKALNPSTTLGDIEYRSATANTNTRLGIGSTGQILSVVAGVPAWVANDVGDITEVQAGTGISVASGTGPVPVITNTVATAIDAKGDLIGGTGADTFARLAVGANDTVLTADSTAATGLKWAAPAGGGAPTYAVFNDKKASTTVSGTFTAGAWRTRVINSTLKNDITGCSIASNQITLAAGTYAINATCGGYNISRSQTRFYNITDSAVAFLGHSDYTISTNNSIISNLAGLIVITGSKTFEVQHYATVTQSTNGFGVDASISGTDEIYLTITIAKVA